MHKNAHNYYYKNEHSYYIDSKYYVLNSRTISLFNMTWLVLTMPKNENKNGRRIQLHNCCC